MKIRRTNDQITRDAALGAVIRQLDTINNVMDAANESLRSLNGPESTIEIDPNMQLAMYESRVALKDAYANIQSWKIKGDRR